MIGDGTPSTSPAPLDLVPLKEAARRVDRSPSTLRDWIRAGELRAYHGEGTHPKNRPTLVSVGELLALAVATGKAAAPGRRPPVEEEEEAAGLRLRLDDHDLGPAAAAMQMPLVPGVHVLTLIEAGGRVIDRVRFTVR